LDFRFSNKIWPTGDFRELKRRTHRFLSARLGDHRIIRSAIDGGITSTVITRIDMTEILKQALEAARTFTPLSKETVATLLARTADAAATGKYELFKTSSRYDGTAHNPQWLG
jgi:hypothetical protein